MKLICKWTGTAIEATEEVAKKLVGHGFELPAKEPKAKPAPKRAPRKTKE